MKVGDLVTMRYSDHRYEGAPKPKGIVVAVDPEGINDEEEVAVLWTSVWCDEANHSADTLEVISEAC
tara:strand:- start:782 stop:982 length:201 start_codon:yes stop_codon:yes gene_type:complete